MESSYVRPTPAGLGSRASRVAARLMWTAATLALVAASVGYFVTSRLDELYMAAVEAGWAHIYTGEVDELSIAPFSVALYYAPLGLLSAGLAVVFQVPSSKRRRFIAAVSVGLCALFVAFAVASVLLTAGEQYVHELFGWWFVPFFLAMTATYCCIAVAATILFWRSRRTGGA